MTWPEGKAVREMTDHLPEKRTPSSEILFYQTEDGGSRIEVRLDENTVWLSQRLLAELFQKDVRTINEHIQNIYEEGELAPEATIRKFRIVQTEKFGVKKFGVRLWILRFGIIHKKVGHSSLEMKMGR